MTLSAAELTDIRFVVGSPDTTILTDAVIQAQYDLAAVDVPSSSLVLPYTYVYLLRRLWGYQRIRADKNTPHGDRQTRSQVTDNSKGLLDYWEGVAGLSGKGILSFGTIDLSLDEADPNL